MKARRIVNKLLESDEGIDDPMQYAVTTEKLVDAERHTRNPPRVVHQGSEGPAQIDERVPGPLRFAYLRG